MSLEPLLGEWTTETLPKDAEPVRGRMAVEPLFGEHYVLIRATVDHPHYPDSLVVIGSGDDAAYRWNYFDNRGVARVYKLTLEDGVWTVWREDPGWWQRYRGRFSADGRTITGAWENSHDAGATWAKDFDLNYTRV